MRTVHLSNETQSSSEERARQFEGELADLYISMIIVVPLAFLLKSLWV